MRRPLAVLATLLAGAFVALPTSASVAAELPSSTLVRHLSDSRINESSGLETSASFAETWYTHNDSGDGPRFFAVGPTGATQAVFTLNGARSWDWEDMSAGPHRTLWLGDIGDNFTKKSCIWVFRVSEPSTLTSANLPFTGYKFRYSDGHSHNAEALMVNPATGRLYIATKQQTGAAIYRAPFTLSASGYNTLIRVAAAPALVTGGDFSPDGQRMVLRTHGTAFLYSQVGATPVQIDLPAEKQGESVTFTRNSADLLVGSEGSNSPVFRVAAS